MLYFLGFKIVVSVTFICFKKSVDEGIDDKPEEYNVECYRNVSGFRRTYTAGIPRISSTIYTGKPSVDNFI